MKKQQIEYNFETENPHDFVLTFSASVTQKYFKSAFLKAVPLAERAATVKITSEPEEMPEFKAQKHFFNVIAVACSSYVKHVRSEVAKDGIKIIDIRVSDCTFKFNKELDEWLAQVEYRGNYVRI